jgi:UPF0716 protein FxsA
MFIKLLLVFTIIPLIELFVLIEIGSRIGSAPTILLLLVTGIFGALLASRQGLSVLQRARQDLSQGRVPANPLLDGIMVLIGGVLLLTPGFLTDILGFLLLIPLTRQSLKGLLLRILRRMMARGVFRIHRF